MTERPPAPVEDQAAADARRARVAALAAGRATKRRHPAQGARIAAAGLGATTLLGLVGAMAIAERPSPTPEPAAATPAPPQVVIVVHRPRTPDVVATTVAPPAVVAPTDRGAATTLSARPTRPTVRPATPQAPAPAPAASTSGSR